MPSISHPFFTCLGHLGRYDTDRIIHRYRKNKIDCLRFVMCPLLAPHFSFFFLFFLLWLLTVLTKQTRQAVCAIKQSTLPRFLWDHFYLCRTAQGGQDKYGSDCHVSLLLMVSLTNFANVNDPLML